VSKKPVLPRALARRDVEAAVDRYSREAGRDVALGFVDALEAAYKAISEQPAAGSPRYAHELGLPGLRTRLLKRYPYLVFYIEHEEHIDIWRVLHAERDIPAWMQEPEN
jgi:toxin ParE1/3/4